MDATTFETTTDLFVAAARRVADDIGHETAVCRDDIEALRDVCRAATAAVDVVSAARASAEAALFVARRKETSR